MVRKQCSFVSCPKDHDTKICLDFDYKSWTYRTISDLLVEIPELRLRKVQATPPFSETLESHKFGLSHTKLVQARCHDFWCITEIPLRFASCWWKNPACAPCKLILIGQDIRNASHFSHLTTYRYLGRNNLYELIKSHSSYPYGNPSCTVSLYQQRRVRMCPIIVSLRANEKKKIWPGTKVREVRREVP